MSHSPVANRLAPVADGLVPVANRLVSVGLVPVANRLVPVADGLVPSKSAQKPRFCARKARKQGFLTPKAHKNPDFVLGKTGIGTRKRGN